MRRKPTNLPAHKFKLPAGFGHPRLTVIMEARKKKNPKEKKKVYREEEKNQNKDEQKCTEWQDKISVRTLSNPNTPAPPHFLREGVDLTVEDALKQVRSTKCQGIFSNKEHWSLTRSTSKGTEWRVECQMRDTKDIGGLIRPFATCGRHKQRFPFRFNSWIGHSDASTSPSTMTARIRAMPIPSRLRGKMNTSKSFGTTMVCGCVSGIIDSTRSRETSIVSIQVTLDSTTRNTPFVTTAMVLYGKAAIVKEKREASSMYKVERSTNSKRQETSKKYKENVKKENSDLSSIESNSSEGPKKKCGSPPTSSSDDGGEKRYINAGDNSSFGSSTKNIPQGYKKKEES